jgi:serine protease Do
MKNLPYLGPSIVVLVAGGVALVVAPMAVRRASDVRATAEIAEASRVLAQGVDITPVGLARQTGDVLAQEGARDPLDDALRVRTSPPAVAGASDALAPHVPLLEQINRAHRAIARLVEPSVVHVSALNTMQRRQFMAPFASSGSGWIWDDEGHIVTNAHVVDGANRLQVQFFDGELRDAELVGLDLRTDIAVIKVAPGGLHPSKRGDSSMVAQGDMVYAFGSPFDFRFSMSAGIVSGLGRSTALDNIDYQNFIQTDAAINPGNSGGPLTDVRGRVIGMNTAIATNSGNAVGQAQFAGIGLAIPMSMIESTVTQIIETGEVRKGYLGVAVISLEEARSGFRLSPDENEAAAMSAAAEAFKGEGAVLGRISPNSPADEAGFRPGDIIMSIDGQKVGNDDAVRAVVSSRRPGDSVRFEVWRLRDAGGERIELRATLAELDVNANIPFNLTNALKRAGIASIATATEDRARALGVPFRRGVLIEELTEGSDLAPELPKGSAITQIFNQPVGSVDEMYTRFARAAEGMGAQRGRRRTFGVIEVPLTITIPDGRVVQVMVPCTGQ